RLRQGYVWFQAGDNLRPGVVAVFRRRLVSHPQLDRLLQVDVVGQEQIARKREARRHDTDQRVRLPVQDQRLADDRWIRVEAAAPEARADHAGSGATSRRSDALNERPAIAETPIVSKKPRVTAAPATRSGSPPLVML